MAKGKKPAGTDDLLFGGKSQARLNEIMGGDGFQTGTSVFDPVLCELSYRWFCPPGGTILDPFAGGSVRGIVAAKLGRRYVGIDLSERQIIANRAQAEEICADGAKPEWRHGNSLEIGTIAADVDADLVFSCPPYADLEVYSDDVRDLSNMSYDQFREAHAAIIKAACDRLKPNRFAVWVVGDVRGADGNYYCFPEDTVAAFKAAGLHKYNECVLVTATGSLPVRTTKAFMASRKLGKTHQNLYVFVKGDSRKAAELMEQDDA